MAFDKSKDKEMSKKLKDILTLHKYNFISSVKNKNKNKSVFMKDGNEITIISQNKGIYLEYDENVNEKFMSFTTALVSDYLNVKPVKAIDFF